MFIIAKKKKICYATYWSPWKSAGVKCWQHHDAVFKYLCKEYNAEIEVAIPPSGGSYLREVINGRKSRLMTSVAELPINFHWDVYDGDFDCLLLELNEIYPVARGSEGDEGSEVTPAQVIADGLEKLIKRAVDNNIPIVWYDADLFLLNGSNGGIASRVEGGPISNFGKDMYEKYFDNSKSTLISCMENHPLYGTVFVPFNVDPETIPDRVKPMHERRCTTRYVGNNYSREHFLSYFNAASKKGLVEVYGVGWTGHKKEYPDVNFYPKASLTQERAVAFYSDAVFGLYGCPPQWVDYKHHTLRIREFLQGGTFIIPENTHLTESILLEELPITTDNLVEDDELLAELMSMSNEQYDSLVRKQRDLILKKYDCRLYVDTYARHLGLGYGEENEG